MNTIHVSASIDIPTVLQKIIHDVTKGDAGRGLLFRAGMTLMARIRVAFVAKAHGQADETGLKWLPLKPSTIAYKRRHPSVLFPGRLRAPFAPSWMLTAKQRRRWWALNALHGAASAWNIIKAEGGKTLIGVYGETKVDILRDLGILLNSFSPGIWGAEGHVFRIEQGKVIVGTNRKYANVHHEGRGNIPQRRLWPEPKNWTKNWWKDITKTIRNGLIEIILARLS